MSPCMKLKATRCYGVLFVFNYLDLCLLLLFAIVVWWMIGVRMLPYIALSFMAESSSRSVGYCLALSLFAEKYWLLAIGVGVMACCFCLSFTSFMLRLELYCWSLSMFWNRCWLYFRTCLTFCWMAIWFLTLEEVCGNILGVLIFGYGFWGGNDRASIFDWVPGIWKLCIIVLFFLLWSWKR